MLMHPELFSNSPCNPFKLPAYRWHRACYLAENKRRCRVGDDCRVQEVTRFCRALRCCQQGRDRARLARKMPDLYAAWQLYRESSLLRWEVEARFLAGETNDVIARKCQLPEAVVDAYGDIFFAVRNRLHAKDWLINVVVGRRAHQGLAEHDQEILLKVYGMRGGPVVLDSLVRYFRNPVTIPAAQDGPDVVGLGDVQLHRLICQSIRILTLPANAIHLPGLVVLLGLLERKQPAGGPDPADLVDHFLADNDPVSLLKFASATTTAPVPCKRSA
jgi:hypothetical protein